jgi:hypothetical protein
MLAKSCKKTGRCRQCKVESGCVQVREGRAENSRMLILKDDGPHTARIFGIAVKVVEDFIRRPGQYAFFHPANIEYNPQSDNAASGEINEA